MTTPSNTFFDWVQSLRRFARFDTVRAEDVNDALDQVTTGFDGVQADVARALKLPAGTADQVIGLTAGQRAGLVVGFDAQGNVGTVAPGYRWRGDWATATVYAANDTVRDAVSKNLYIALATHTAGTLAADIADGKWSLVMYGVDVATAVAAAQAAEASRAAAATAAAAAVNAPGSLATSGTPLAIGTGTRTLTLVESGKVYAAGQWVVVASQANPLNQMSGPITAYDPATRVLAFDSRALGIGGAGTYADWGIGVTGSGANAASLADVRRVRNRIYFNEGVI